MNIKTITLIINQIAEDKNISKEKVIEVLEQALASAYKKEYGKKNQKIEAKIDPKTGKIAFWQLKEIVKKEQIYSQEELKKLKEKSVEKEEDKLKFNPEKHILLEEAKKIDPQAEPGKILKLALEPAEDFGRIATQTAKQVILQKLREAEKEAILAEYKKKEGEVISGIVQRVEQAGVYFDIGKATGFLPKAEQVKGEFYRPGQRIKLYVLKVEDTPKGPKVLLSRAYPKLVSKLFELEVPEIVSGQIKIKAIAREPGSRTKIAIFSEEEGLDPIGSAIGQRGSRVGAVITELGGEKIDIIEYTEDQEQYIKNALSPAKVKEVKIMPKNTALALVEKDQLSLAIGREGQNVRLAANLTGWKIDVKSIEEVEKGDKKE
jgi:N utilization substance protein A